MNRLNSFLPILLALFSGCVTHAPRLSPDPKEVVLGVHEEIFLRSHPNAKVAYSFPPDKGIQTDLLGEIIPNAEFFGMATYSFRNKRLVAAIWGPSTDWDSELIWNKKRKLISGLYAQLGKPSEIRIIKRQVHNLGELLIPQLVWSRPDKTIALIVPPENLKEYGLVLYELRTVDPVAVGTQPDEPVNADIRGKLLLSIGVGRDGSLQNNSHKSPSDENAIEGTGNADK